MNALFSQLKSAGAEVRRVSALTLPETMIAIAIFSLLIVAAINVHLFGLRQNEMVSSKLGASDQSRRAFSSMAAVIRAARMWQIGSGSQTMFNAVTNGTIQQGNALQIHLGSDTNAYVRYYLDATNSELHRVISGESVSTVVACYLTNRTPIFRAEDYHGNVKTDLSSKSVIRILLEFYQYQYPLTKVGPGYYYDYYKLEFRVTPHCSD